VLLVVLSILDVLPWVLVAVVVWAVIWVGLLRRPCGGHRRR
jgi:hypothetical protein